MPCLIRACIQEKALADLRASINMMPYSILKKLGLGEQKKKIRMSIQFPNRTMKHLRVTIEDILVKVDKFIFLINFVIMN